METLTTFHSATDEQQSGTRRWLTLIAVLGATLLAAIDIFIVNVGVPTIERELHTGFAEIQLVVAGYTLAYAALLVTGGRLGDLYGRKRLFLLGVGGFTVFSALCGFAPNAFSLIIFRIGQGAASAMMTPQVIAFIQVNFTPRERPTAMSAYIATLGLASILGLVLGGGLIAANILGMGWRSIFLINVPIGLLVLIAASLLLRESKEPGKSGRSLDYGGVILLTLALLLFVFPLVMGGNTGWPLWTILCLVLSLPCIMAFWAYERRMMRQGRAPLISPALLQQRLFIVGSLLTLLNGILWNGILFLFSIYLQTILHFTPLQSGLSMAVGSIAFIIASLVSTPIMRRPGRWNFSIAAGVITLGSLLVLLAAQFLVAHWGIFPVLVAFFVLAFGQALFYTPLMPKTLEEVTPAQVGAASGVYTTTMQMSAALGVAIIGIIYANLAVSGERPLEAFVFTLLLITLLSMSTIFFARFLKPGRSQVISAASSEAIEEGVANI